MTIYKSKLGEIYIGHEEKSIFTIKEIVKNFNPELIVELGTSHGGMTSLLLDVCSNAEIHSYDLYNEKQRKDMAWPSNVTFHVGDILGGFNFKTINRAIPYKQLVNVCSDKRRKLLYCDNGNKIIEILIYGKLLNKGDMLGCHDWPYEVKYSDVKEVLKNFDAVDKNFYFENNGLSSRFFIKKTK